MLEPVMRARLVLLCWVLPVALGVGCRTAMETVPIASEPPGATVLIDGTDRGRTPLTVELSKKESHRVELRLPGYRPHHFTITTRQADNLPLLRFGMLADNGHYQELTAPTTPIELQSELIPTSRPIDPFGDFGSRVLELDRQLENGQISPAEHARILEQLIKAYQE